MVTSNCPSQDIEDLRLVAVDVRRRSLAGRDLLLHDGVGFAGLFAEHLEGHSATEDAEHLTRTGLAKDRDSRLRLRKKVLTCGH
jgi:hypothetical protein